MEKKDSKRYSFNESNIFMRKYDSIREIIRNIYIYGCFNKSDMLDKNSIAFVGKDNGKRNIEKHSRRIENCLNGTFLERNIIDKKLIYRCKYNMFEHRDNFLENTFKNKTFSINDFGIYFQLMNVMVPGKKYKISELLDKITDPESDIVLGKDTFSNKLSYLVDASIIKEEKNKSGNLYSLADNIFDKFETDELINIYILLEFIGNTSPIEIPFSFAKKRLGKYLKYFRNTDIEDFDILCFRHNHLFNVIDNEVMYTILEAIKDNKSVTFKNTNKIIGEKDIFLIPALIIHECIYGRQYVLGYNKKTKLKEVHRLDRIKSIKIGNYKESYTDIITSTKDDYLHSKDTWGTSPSNIYQTVRVLFTFDEDTESFIKRRLEREIQGGSIKKLSKGKYLYTVDALNPYEMIPWIRSFGERAIVIDSGDYKIEDKIKSSWEEVIKNYENF